jgi:hypothetical protein
MGRTAASKAIVIHRRYAQRIVHVNARPSIRAEGAALVRRSNRDDDADDAGGR